MNLKNILPATKRNMKINEIFYSIQGESTYTGLPCVFVRFSGCNLRCRYCDTKYAYYDGQEMSIDEVIKKVNSFFCDLVEITGGEPLLQAECAALAEALLQLGKTVLVETNGSQPISVLKYPVVRIMDVKCPGSLESEKMRLENIEQLREADNVKFVITDRSDFDWAIKFVTRHRLLEKCAVLFSPAFGILPASELAAWLLEISLPIRLQLQLHKYIWNPAQRGV